MLIGSRAASRCLQLQPSLLHYNYTIHSLATAQLQTTNESFVLELKQNFLPTHPLRVHWVMDPATLKLETNLREDFTIKINRGGSN